MNCTNFKILTFQTAKNIKATLIKTARIKVDTSKAAIFKLILKIETIVRCSDVLLLTDGILILFDTDLNTFLVQFRKS